MNVTSWRGRFSMNDEQLQQMTDRIVAGDRMNPYPPDPLSPPAGGESGKHIDDFDSSLENFCMQIMDAAPQMRTNFQQELEMRVIPVRKPVSRLTWMRPARLVAMLAITLFAVVAVVYAIDAIVQRAREMDAGLSGVEGYELNISQTVDVYTVNLQWAHADANRVSVAMGITGADGVPYTNLTPRNATLMDDAGNVFTSNGGYGSGIADGMSGEVLTFDTSSLSELPDVLNLHLEMSIDVLTTQSRTQTPNGDYDDWNIGPVGVFIFDFSVPTTAAQLIELHESVEVAGVTVTLQRVTISESQTRVVVCFDPPDMTYTDWLPIVNLFVDGQNVIETWDSPAGGGFIVGTNCSYMNYNAPLSDQTGEWRVEVPQLVGTRVVLDDSMAATMVAIAESVDRNGDTTGYSMPEGGLEEAGVQMRVDGPWVFTFDVP
jgi:hypothetical protein